MDVALVSPQQHYQASFLQALAEIQAEAPSNPFIATMTEARLDIPKLATKDGFQAYVDRLALASTRQTVTTTGRVPHTTKWLVDRQQQRFLGRLDVRHFLTDRLRQSYGHMGYIIRPGFRGQGLGRKIVELGLQLAATVVQDADLYQGKILLACREGNHVSMQLLLHLGAEFDRVVELPTGERELLYWVALPFSR